MTVSNPDTRRMLELSLTGVRARVATLDKKIEEAKTERAAEAQTQAAVAGAALAARETKLSEEERQNYRRFLEKAYFTKQDFGGLNTFYRHSYDRLSEDGKEQMSQRIHEGIRRGEFQFTDLPPEIQQKDNTLCLAKADKEIADNTKVARNSDDAGFPAKAVATTHIKDVDLSAINLSGVQLTEVNRVPSAAAIPAASGPRTNQR